MKTKAVNKDVRVYGKVKDNDSIFVDHIDVKYGDKYVPLCNWEQRMKDNEH
jgi:hypothetical protein